MTVSAARRLVGHELEQAGRPDLVADASLVVSELVCNAVIHAGTEILVHVQVTDALARIEVDDGSPVMPAWTPSTDGALSGRGLTLVNALTTRWGAHLLASGGKSVWFELAEAHEAPAQGDAEQLLEQWAALDDLHNVAVLDDPRCPRRPTDGGVEVVLPGISADLLLRSRDHSDSLVREFKLLLLNTEARVTHEHSTQQLVQLARRVDTAAEEFATARHQLRHAALTALAAGQERVTVRLRLPAHLAGAAERYRDALNEADEHCSTGRMLTEGLTPQQRELRAGVLDEIARQLRAGG